MHFLKIDIYIHAAVWILWVHVNIACRVSTLFVLEHLVSVSAAWHGHSRTEASFKDRFSLQPILKHNTRRDSHPPLNSYHTIYNRFMPDCSLTLYCPVHPIHRTHTHTHTHTRQPATHTYTQTTTSHTHTYTHRTTSHTYHSLALPEQARGRS